MWNYLAHKARRPWVPMIAVIMRIYCRPVGILESGLAHPDHLQPAGEGRRVAVGVEHVERHRRPHEQRPVKRADVLWHRHPSPDSDPLRPASSCCRR
jgi:hypothetical protein